MNPDATGFGGHQRDRARKTFKLDAKNALTCTVTGGNTPPPSVAPDALPRLTDPDELGFSSGGVRMGSLRMRSRAFVLTSVATIGAVGAVTAQQTLSFDEWWGVQARRA
jgi:hypothetical protein